MVIEPPHIILIPSSKSELSDSKADIFKTIKHYVHLDEYSI